MSARRRAGRSLHDTEMRLAKTYNPKRKRSLHDVGEAALIYTLLAKPHAVQPGMTPSDTLPAVAERDHRPRARVRVERQIGRASGARLTIDHLQFDLTDHDCESLARQLVLVLAAQQRARAKEER